MTDHGRPLNDDVVVTIDGWIIDSAALRDYFDLFTRIAKDIASYTGTLPADALRIFADEWNNDRDTDPLRVLSHARNRPPTALDRRRPIRLTKRSRP